MSILTMIALPRQTRAGLLLTLIAVLSAPLTHADDVPVDGIAAVVNENVVLFSDVRAEIGYLKAQASSNRQQLPGDNVLQERVLDRLIDQEILRGRASSLGIVISATDVNRAIDRIARSNNMDGAQFRQTLLQQGFDLDQFRRGIEHELRVQRLVERDVAPQVRVSAREIDDYVSSLRNNAADQRRYRLRHILLAIPASATDDIVEAARTRAATLVSRLRAGEDFAALAATESDGARALEGGDLGFRTQQEVPAFLRKVLTSLEPGEISEPLRSPDGLHIIRVDERRDGDGSQREETLARHIFIAGNEAGTEARLTSIRERLQRGESFAAIAAAESEDPNSAPEGGELPWFGAGELPPEMERAAANLQAGETSAPFRTQFGWHVLEVMDRRVRDIDDDALRQRASNVLSEQRVEEETERWVRRLRDESFIEKRS